MTLRTVLLTLHVAGGGLGLLAGIFAIRPPLSKQRRVLAQKTTKGRMIAV